MSKRKYFFEVGDVFNEFVVIDSKALKIDDHISYKVECLCGEKVYRQARYLASGRTKRCKACSCKKTFSEHPMIGFKKEWEGTGYGDISGTWFSIIKHGAKRRNYGFDLTIKELWSLAEQQNFRCAITGQEIIFSKSLKNQSANWDIITASLDRIDSSEGYYLENVQWVHKDINRFKNNYTMEKFIKMCQMVVNNLYVP